MYKSVSNAVIAALATPMPGSELLPIQRSMLHSTEPEAEPSEEPEDKRFPVVVVAPSVVPAPPITGVSPMANTQQPVQAPQPQPTMPAPVPATPVVAQKPSWQDQLRAKQQSRMIAKLEWQVALQQAGATAGDVHAAAQVAQRFPELHQRVLAAGQEEEMERRQNIYGVSANADPWMLRSVVSQPWPR